MFGDIGDLQISIDQLNSHVECIREKLETIVNLIEPIDQYRSILR